MTCPLCGGTFKKVAEDLAICTQCHLTIEIRKKE